jgi:protein-S-isoprenylcysteine O-methyltransferase Ste14
MKPPHAILPPNTIPWPPIIYGFAVVAALLLGRVVPIGTIIPPALRATGVAVMLAGIVLDISAMVTMRRHRANILPHRAATALVTAWPFSVSRNPIYLGNTVLLAGAALAFNRPWLLAMDAVAVAMLTRLAIGREEAHLAAVFGVSWIRYAGRVPRWLRLRR